MTGMFEWINQVFLHILQYSIYAALIALAILIVRALLAKKLPALFSCALWGIVLIRLLLPLPLPLPSITAWTDTPVKQSIQSNSSITSTDSADSPSFENDGTHVKEQPFQAPASSTNQSDPIAIPKDTVFDPMLLLGLIWLAGFGTLIVRIAIASLLTRRRLKFAVRLHCDELASECASLAGIRYREGIYMSEQFSVPVLFGIVRPRIILPLCAKDMSETEMKHAILHEMVLKKRGDMWLKALWTIVLYVNWFNPVLWLADRLFSRDMERACDERVIRILGMNSKKAYALSLLNVALNINQGAAAGKAIAFARGNVKQRIEGVLSLEKCSRAVTALSLVLVLGLSVVLLAACQPTPDKPVIVQRDELENKVQETTAPVVKYEVPDTWADTVDMKGSSVEVKIDATVSVPDVESYPVYNVEKALISQDMIDSLMDDFVQDRNVFTIDYQKTKSELEEELVEAKRGQLIDDEYVVTEDSKAYVEELQKMIEEAPETVDRSEQYVTEFSLKEDGTGFNGYVELGDNDYGSVSASANEFCFTNGWYPAPESQLISQFGKGVQGELEISEDEAIKAVQECLGEFGIDYMIPASIEKALFYPKTSLNPNVAEVDAESKGYFMEFVRNIDGIDTALFEHQGYFSNEKFTYSAPWLPESLKVYIDEDANVQHFEWRYPLTLTKLVSENALLMDFEDMKEKIRNQMFYSCSFYNGYEDMSVTVERIELKMTLTSVKDHPDEAMYVPAWYIHYVRRLPVNYTDDFGKQITEQADDAYIVLNAIDGGSICPYSASRASAEN